MEIEFVTDEEEWHSPAPLHRTGWETIRFEVGDVEEPSEEKAPAE
jgi:hypothetical protein